MERTEAIAQYNQALKQGQKCRKNDVLHGRYPYLQVLDELIDDSMIAGQTDMGLLEIPAERIVGTKAAGRKTAFASNFMPLLGEETEFGMKWITLCEAHLSDEGIRDPIQCYEYMGRFYVQEGNKRVSVLLSYGASTIPGHVTRIIPAYADDPEIKIYYEFMRYYQLSGLYQTSFTQEGSSAKLQAALGFEPDHVWSKDERAMFLARYARFRDFYRKRSGEKLKITVADAMLVWLQIYSFQDLKDMVASELANSLERVWPDILLLCREDPMKISTEPPVKVEEKGILSHFLGTTPDHIQVAFLFQDDPTISAFARSHRSGARYVEKHMQDSVTVRYYYHVKDDDTGEWVMAQAIAEGAQVLIATVPSLIGICRKVAAKYPQVKILNCALSMASSGVRTYYSRGYETKFITGAVAAAMSKEDTLGYVANYPIYGVPASINAFALGARMVRPEIRVKVAWTCTPGTPWEEFQQAGIRVISNRELPSPEKDEGCWEWGTYRCHADGSVSHLAAPCWNWGIFYEKVLTSILNGSWDSMGGQAVNYWWGMDSGVIDVQLAPDLPEGVRALAKMLKEGLIYGTIHPFDFRLTDQAGVLRSDGSKVLTPEEIMHMDYLLDCVDGTIPQWDELLPMSRRTVRILGLYRDEIPPEKEGVLL